MIVSRSALGAPGRPGANDRIQGGVIGVGGRGNLLIDQMPDSGQIVAVADCDLMRCDQAASKRQAKWSTYQDYRKLLERKDLDGIVVATNEHWHVLCAMHACIAGKDVYVENPLSLMSKRAGRLCAPRGNLAVWFRSGASSGPWR